MKWQHTYFSSHRRQYRSRSIRKNCWFWSWQVDEPLWSLNDIVLSPAKKKIILLILWRYQLHTTEYSKPYIPSCLKRVDLAWQTPQFYIQLLFKPHLGIWFLPFGLLGSKEKISETTEILLKYATFSGGFFNFLWAKIVFRIFLKIF